MALSDYTNLITSQHADKPKFTALVGVLSQCFADLQSFLDSLPREFDVDEARYKQLDVIGEWVGLDRNLRATAPGVYIPAPPTGVVPLADPDYKTLLRGKIGSNNWDGTLAGAYDKVTYIFGDTGSRLFIIDNQDMSITVCVAGMVPSDAFKAALAGGYMQVRPCGVLANYLYPTEPGGPLFGFGTDNEFIGGFGAGVWRSTT